MTVDQNDRVDTPTTDAGFTLPEVLIVIVLMGILMPVLAMAFSVVIRTSPVSDARADDSRSLNNLTNWISQDVSSTSEDGFYVGASALDGGCDPLSLPASKNLLELHWKEGTKEFVSNYRFVSNTPADGKGRIFRYACMKGQPASELRMTAELNEVAASVENHLAPAPVRIEPVPTVRADGSPGIKGVQLVVLIFDDSGLQRELLNLDATTTNVATLLPGATGGFGGTNTAPEAGDLAITMTQGATRLESLPAIDPNGDLLFTTFPGSPHPVPPGWNLLATGTTIEITPDPAAAPATHSITYRVTDPAGFTDDATLEITTVAPSANQLPVAQSLSMTASRSVAATGTLVFSDPEGETLQPVLVAGDIPAGWTASVTGNQFSVTPSATATTSVIRYTVTDSMGQTATSQITVDLCEVYSMSATPNTVGVKGGGLDDPVTVEISTNGACGPLVLGFLPNDTSAVEATESFYASNVVTIGESTSYAWIRPGQGIERVVPLNVRQGANGPILLSVDLTTTR